MCGAAQEDIHYDTAEGIIVNKAINRLRPKGLRVSPKKIEFYLETKQKDAEVFFSKQVTSFCHLGSGELSPNCS